MNKPALQLTDEEMRDFIINGYVKVKSRCSRRVFMRTFMNN